VLTDHDLASEGDGMQEDCPHSSAISPVSSEAGDGRTLIGRGGMGNLNLMQNKTDKPPKAVKLRGG